MPYCTLSKKIVLPVFFILFLPALINAQEKNEKLIEKQKLEKALAEAKTTGERIKMAVNLAAFHFNNKNQQAGDSLIKLMFEWANQSGKKEDMFLAYRSSGFAYNNSSNPQKALPQYLLALDYSTRERMFNEEAFMLATIGRLHGRLREFEKAREYFNRVELNKEGIEDSTRYHYFYRKSESYFIQGNILEGIRNLLQARKYAIKTKITRHIADANHGLGENFLRVKDYKKSVSYYQAAKKVVEQSGDFDRVLLEDLYIADAYRESKNIILAESLLTEVIRKAGSSNNYSIKYRAAGSLWAMHYYENDFVKLTATAKKYELEQYHISNRDTVSLYSVRGVIAEGAGNYDSADWYYNHVLDFVHNSPLKTLKAICNFNNAEYYKKHKRFEEALPRYKTALAIFDSLNDVPSLPKIYLGLDSVYSALDDFKNAYQAKSKYLFYKDSLEKMNDKEEILREELVAEEETIKKTEEEEIAATERKHNIQYRFIILGVILLLVGLLTIGFFHPPQWLVKGLAFVSFIFIFEFIILILDSKLHHWFHGAPLPILGVKVLIACLLVPLHHLVEKKVIHFLQSKKLHRLKTVFKDEPVKSV